MIILRATKPTDLETLFRFQADEEAMQQAAFTPKDPFDKAAYIEKYTSFLSNSQIRMHTIRIGDTIAGSIAKYVTGEDAEITYWIGKQHWGRGVATEALRQFLLLEQTRPLYARTVADNIGSQKVVQKNGFKRTGTDKGFANARQAEVKEFIYRLDG